MSKKGPTVEIRDEIPEPESILNVTRLLRSIRGYDEDEVQDVTVVVAYLERLAVRLLKSNDRTEVTQQAND